MLGGDDDHYENFDGHCSSVTSCSQCFALSQTQYNCSYIMGIDKRDFCTSDASEDDIAATSMEDCDVYEIHFTGASRTVGFSALLLATIIAVVTTMLYI